METPFFSLFKYKKEFSYGWFSLTDFYLHFPLEHTQRAAAYSECQSRLQEWFGFAGGNRRCFEEDKEECSGLSRIEDLSIEKTIDQINQLEPSTSKSRHTQMQPRPTTQNDSVSVSSSFISRVRMCILAPPIDLTKHYQLHGLRYFQEISVIKSIYLWKYKTKVGRRAYFTVFKLFWIQKNLKKIVPNFILPSFLWNHLSFKSYF